MIVNKKRKLSSAEPMQFKFCDNEMKIDLYLTKNLLIALSLGMALAVDEHL